MSNGNRSQWLYQDALLTVVLGQTILALTVLLEQTLLVLMGLLGRTLQAHFF